MCVRQDKKSHGSPARDGKQLPRANLHGPQGRGYKGRKTYDPLCVRFILAPINECRHREKKSPT